MPPKAKNDDANLADHTAEVREANPVTTAALDARITQGTREISEVRATVKQMAEALTEMRSEVDNLSTLVVEKLTTAHMEPDPVEAPVATVGVYRKIAEVMAEVEAIGKEGEANHTGGRYKFRGVDQAMDAVGRALRKVGLIFSTRVIDAQYDVREVSNGNKVTVWTSARITMSYTFIDPADGSSMTGSMIGEGRDMGDKATSKAEAMALKYFLFQALLIPVEGTTGQDSEHEHPVIGGDSEAPVRRQAPAQQRGQSQVITDPAQQMEQATRALNAARTPGTDLVAIREYATALGINGVIIEGMPLSNHFAEMEQMMALPSAPHGGDA